jgi:hypothetical protein
MYPSPVDGGGRRKIQWSVVALALRAVRKGGRQACNISFDAANRSHKLQTEGNLKVDNLRCGGSAIMGIRIWEMGKFSVR